MFPVPSAMPGDYQPGQAMLPPRLTRRLLIVVLALSMVPIALIALGWNTGMPLPTPIGGRFAIAPSTEMVTSVAVMVTLLSWSAFCVALFTATLAILHSYLKRDMATPVIGTAFFYVAVMEMFATLYSAQMLELMADPRQKLPAVWTATRLFHALILLAGASMLLTKAGERWKGRFRAVVIACVVFAGLAFGLVYFISETGALPTFIQRGGLVARRYDLLPLVLYLIAGVFVYPRLHRKIGSTFSLALLLSVIPDIATQLHLAFGSRELFDAHYIAASILKILAYAIPLTGLIWDYMWAHRAVQEHVKRLQAEMAERSRAEAQREQSEQRMREFFDHANDLIQITTADGRYLFANRAWRAAIHLDDAPLTDLTFLDLIDEKDREAVQTYLEQVLAGEDPGQIAFTLCPRHGDMLLVEGNTSRLVRKGEPIALYTSMRDITERQRVLDNLRATRGELDLFFSLSIDLLAILEDDGTFKRISPAWCEVLGYEAEALRGKPCLNYIAPEDRDKVAGQLLSLREGASRCAFECRMVCAGGIVKWFSWASCPYHERNLIYVAARDDSDRKRFEHELLNAKLEADAANQSKSAFLASMSHEIRTPLNAILGMADLLGEDELTADQIKYVDVLKSSGNSLLNLINDILDLSKVEAGQLEIEAIEFDLHELVENVSHMLAMRAQEKGIELLLYIDPAVPRDLVGDPTRLRQILINLAGNAVKFTERGEVFIQGEVQNRSDADIVLRFSVRDTGIGIPTDRLDRIFESFTQADSTVARKYGGTGLGLAISKRLVTLMGGDIQVESTLGRGTTFWFTVHLGRPEGASRTMRPPPPPMLMPGARAIVIDQNQTSQHIVRELLGEQRIETDIADDAETALRQLREAKEQGTPYRFAFVDSGGADLHGLGIVGRIRKGELVERVVMMVPYQQLHEVKATMRRYQGIHYLVKPVHREEVHRAVAVSRERPRRATDSTIMSRHEPPAAAVTSPAPVPAPAITPLRILLAEDTEDNRVLFKFYLKDTPHSVDIAVNGVEAVALFREHEYDLVLMDIEMPEMNGYEAARRIRELEKERQAVGGELREVPILTLTAHAMTADKEKCLQAGFDGFLAKPIRKAELLQAIHDHSPDAE